MGMDDCFDLILVFRQMAFSLHSLAHSLLLLSAHSHSVTHSFTHLDCKGEKCRTLWNINITSQCSAFKGSRTDVYFCLRHFLMNSCQKEVLERALNCQLKS